MGVFELFAQAVAGPMDGDKIIGDAERGLRLHNAFSEGQRAFRVQQPRSANPYPSESQEHIEWERGRAMNEEAT